MLTVQNLCYTYQNKEQHQGLPALSDINVIVKDGELLCIIGPSGSGKSTFLDILAGFTKPTSGSIFLDGHQVTAPHPERGVIFQEPNLFPWLTVLENVAFGLLCQGTLRKRAFRIAKEMLDLVGLSDFAHFRPHELSGGMRQRVALARVLAFDPKILLMDEPFSALDAQTRRKLQDELLYICELKRKTVVFITHNVEEAVYLADRVIVFCSRPGQVKAEIEIDLPKPRKLSEPAFLHYRDKITDLIEVQEVLA